MWQLRTEKLQKQMQPLIEDTQVLAGALKQTEEMLVKAESSSSDFKKKVEQVRTEERMRSGVARGARREKGAGGCGGRGGERERADGDGEPTGMRATRPAVALPAEERGTCVCVSRALVAPTADGRAGEAVQPCRPDAARDGRRQGRDGGGGAAPDADGGPARRAAGGDRQAARRGPRLPAGR
eukprot:782218-Prymnesium_polylepis.1